MEIANKRLLSVQTAAQNMWIWIPHDENDETLRHVALVYFHFQNN